MVDASTHSDFKRINRLDCSSSAGSPHSDPIMALMRTMSRRRADSTMLDFANIGSPDEARKLWPECKERAGFNFGNTEIRPGHQTYQSRYDCLATASLRRYLTQYPRVLATWDQVGCGILEILECQCVEFNEITCQATQDVLCSDLQCFSRGRVPFALYVCLSGLLLMQNWHPQIIRLNKNSQGRRRPTPATRSGVACRSGK